MSSSYSIATINWCGVSGSPFEFKGYLPDRHFELFETIGSSLYKGENEYYHVWSNFLTSYLDKFPIKDKQLLETLWEAKGCFDISGNGKYGGGRFMSGLERSLETKCFVDTTLKDDPVGYVIEIMEKLQRNEEIPEFQPSKLLEKINQLKPSSKNIGKMKDKEAFPDASDDDIISLFRLGVFAYVFYNLKILSIVAKQYPTVVEELKQLPPYNPIESKRRMLGELLENYDILMFQEYSETIMSYDELEELGFVIFDTVKDTHENRNKLCPILIREEVLSRLQWKARLFTHNHFLEQPINDSPNSKQLGDYIAEMTMVLLNCNTPHDKHIVLTSVHFNSEDNKEEHRMANLKLRQLMDNFTDGIKWLIGADTNSSLLTAEDLGNIENVFPNDPSQLTENKTRSTFGQPQSKKEGKNDRGQKMRLYSNQSVSDPKIVVIPPGKSKFEEVEDEIMLMPTTEFPADHAVVTGNFTM